MKTLLAQFCPHYYCMDFFLVCVFVNQFFLTPFFFFPGFVDVVDIAVYRNELFCLHGNGRLSHFSLLSAERCVERLLRRESWTLAATVCCMFQHTITTGRVRHRRCANR